MYMMAAMEKPGRARMAINSRQTMRLYQAAHISRNSVNF